MNAWRVEELLSVRGHGEESVVNIRRIPAPLDRSTVLRPRPVVVLHQDDEDFLDVVLGLGRSLSSDRCAKTQNYKSRRNS